MDSICGAKSNVPKVVTNHQNCYEGRGANIQLLQKNSHKKDDVFAYKLSPIYIKKNVRGNQSYICGIQIHATNVVYRLEVVNDLEYSSEKIIFKLNIQEDTAYIHMFNSKTYPLALMSVINSRLVKHIHNSPEYQFWCVID